jgi:hypothetical protein
MDVSCFQHFSFGGKGETTSPPQDLRTTVQPLDDGTELATTELEHQPPELVIGFACKFLKPFDLGLADRLLLSDELVEARQGQVLKEVEPGQELYADAAQVGGRLVNPVQKDLAALRCQVIHLARRAVGLELCLNCHQTCLFQLFELGVELAQPDLPDASQAVAELLMQFVAMLGLGHQQTQQGWLWGDSRIARHGLHPYSYCGYSQCEYPGPLYVFDQFCQMGAAS